VTAEISEMLRYIDTVVVLAAVLVTVVVVTVVVVVVVVVAAKMVAVLAVVGNDSTSPAMDQSGPELSSPVQVQSRMIPHHVQG
jgi:hypothetical protein